MSLTKKRDKFLKNVNRLVNHLIGIGGRRFIFLEKLCYIYYSSASEGDPVVKRLIITSILLVFAIAGMPVQAAKKGYGAIICEQAGFTCYKVKQGDTWKKLFPDADARDVVRRVNRTNMSLRQGSTIAVPTNLDGLSHFDVSPFPLKMNPTGQKTVIVELKKLAWGAYDEEGNLVHWGPASGGQGWCGDVGKPCRTHTGNYSVLNKKDYNCTSSIFPLPYGGAAMPYCMHYYKAFAMHGSFEVPGYNASHGCIRMFINDARWLNYDFSDYGTQVVVKPY